MLAFGVKPNQLNSVVPVNETETAMKKQLQQRYVDAFVQGTPGGKKILKVLGLAEKRGPASFAVTLYEDQTPPEVKELAPPRFERGCGRPTKKDRRMLNRLRGR